jgi:hypothetical protein
MPASGFRIMEKQINNERGDPIPEARWELELQLKKRLL